jgi:fatty acid desaturase
MATHRANPDSAQTIFISKLCKRSSWGLCLLTDMLEIIRNKKDIWSVAIGVTSPVFMIIFLIIDTSNFAYTFILWLALWIFICRNNYILHNHIHFPMLGSKLANKLFDILLALSTAMPAGNWKIMHVHGHHVEHKVQDLPSRSYAKLFFVPSYDEVRWYDGIIFSISRIPYQFFYPIRFLLKGLFSPWPAKRAWAKHYIFDYLIILAFAIFMLALNFERALFGVLSIYILVYFISIYIDFYTHVRETKTQESGVTFSNVCHSAMYNKMFWNFGYHVGHHTYPEAHWSQLPEIERKMGITSSDVTAFKALNIFGFMKPSFHRWKIPTDKRIDLD